MVFVKYFLWGVIIKFVTGIDDTLTRVPVISYLTKTKRGKLAFAFGIYLAMIVAVVVAVFFSSFIREIPYYRYVVTGFLLLVAVVVYFELFTNKEKDKKEGAEIKKIKKISNKRMIKLVAYGFIVAFVTLIDDILAYSVVFLNKEVHFLVPASGILVAGLFQVFLVVYFSKHLDKLKYKKEIGALGLIVIAGLVVSGVL